MVHLSGDERAPRTVGESGAIPTLVRGVLRSRIVAIAGTSGDLAAILRPDGSPLARRPHVGHFGSASGPAISSRPAPLRAPVRRPPGPRSWGPRGATRGRQGVIVPSTSLSLVEAWLPVIVVLSMWAVPKLAMPPPTPTLNRSVTPGWPGVATPLTPLTPREIPAESARGAAPGARLPARSGQGLIGRDDVGGLGLLGPLLRPQPGLEREGPGGRVEDPAADAAGALAAVAAGAAGGAAAGGRARDAGAAAAAARGAAAGAAGAAGAAYRLVGRDVTVTPVKEAVPALNRPPPSPLPASPPVPPAPSVEVPPPVTGSPLAEPPLPPSAWIPPPHRPRRWRCRRRRPGRSRRCRRWRDSR